MLVLHDGCKLYTVSATAVVCDENDRTVFVRRPIPSNSFPSSFFFRNRNIDGWMNNGERASLLLSAYVFVVGFRPVGILDSQEPDDGGIYIYSIFVVPAFRC